MKDSIKKANILERLIEPSAAILEPERRRRARLLSALLATLTIFGIVSVVVTLYTAYHDSDLLINTGATLFLASIYYLSRTRYYNLTALLTVSTISGAVFVAIAFHQEVSTLYLLIIGVLVGGLFLSRRATAVIMALTIVGIVFVWVSFPALLWRDIAIIIFAVLSVGILGIITITIRQQDVEKIQEQDRTLIKDITERKHAEEALRKSETNLIEAMKIAGLGNWEYDIAQDQLTFNDQFYKLLHTTAEEQGGYLMSSGQYTQKFVYPDDMAVIGVEIQKAIETNDPNYYSTLSHRVICADGNINYMTVHIRIEKDAQGRTVKAHGVNQDITARKQAEEALQEKEKRFRALIENSADAITLLDANGIAIYDSPSAPGMLGYGPEYWIGKNVFELIHVDDSQKILGMFRTLAKTPGAHIDNTFRLRHKNGSWLWIEAVATNLLAEPSVQAIVVNYRDITERKQTEEALRESEEKYRSLITDTSEGIFVTDNRGILTFVNPALAHMLGLESSDQLSGRNFIEFVAPSKVDEVIGYFKQAIQTGHTRESTIVDIIRADGMNAVVEVKTMSVIQNGQVIGNRGVLHDITKRTRAEETLRESEEKYRTLVEKMNEGVIIVDNKDVIQFVNNRFAQMVGYSEQELLGSVAYNLFVHEEDQNLVKEKNQLRLKQKSDEYELRMKTKSGETIWVRVNGTPLLNTYGNVVGSIGINTDITEHKKFEEELKNRLSDFEAVNQLSVAMRDAETLEELLPIVLDVTLGVLHTPTGIIWLYDKTKDELRPAVTRGYAEQNSVSPIQPEKPGKGIAGYVFSTRQLLVERDYHSSQRLPASIREQIPPGMGGANIPIRASDNVIGTLSIGVLQPRELSQKDIQLLITLSEIAGNAIQRITLHQQTERRLQHLAALSVIDRSIMSSFDLRTILEMLLNQVVGQLGIDAADILLFDSNSLMLERIAEHGFQSKGMIRQQPRLDKGYAGQAILNSRKIKIADIKEQYDDEFLVMMGAQEGFVTYFAVPLMAKGYTKGVLEVFSRTPLEPDAEWIDFLDILAGQAAIAIDNVTLFESLQRSNFGLSLAYDATIEGWSRALDLRDKETEGHTQRVTDLTVKLARTFGLNQEELTQVRRGALLHDIGKMGIPDAILLKPGPLTPEEWEIMRKHPIFAYEMLSPIQYLSSALDIPYCHHEKWDGTGYPRGLKGEEILLVARIFAIVDVWDALKSDRPDRAAWSTERVIEHIRSLSGTHFDPEVLKRCLESGIFTSSR